jgi:signal transduction histidine kinase
MVVNISSNAHGENNLKRLNDSLRFELKNTGIDTVKAAIMIQLAENLLYSNPDSAMYFGEKALQIAERENLIQVQLGTIGFIGNTLINTGDLPKALELGFQAIEMAKDVPIRVAGIGPTIDNMGRIYYLIGNYEKAMYYFEEMVEMGDADIVGVAFGYLGLAKVYERLNMLDSAMICLNKSFQTFSTFDHSFFPTVYHVTPDWYNVRAKIYFRLNKRKEALKDLFTTLQMTIRNDEAFHTANTCNEISGYYRRINQTDSAIYYAEKGLFEATRVSYSLGILNASEILAEQYDSKDAVKALYYLKLAKKTRNKIYGAGNIQIIRDMIAQNEDKQQALQEARIESRNRIRLNTLLGSLFTLLVIAILLFRNNRIKQKAKQKIENAFDQLKATQAQLIQSEKMASLGELTAGIAHEIQNPLNFVNNFSELNQEMLEELESERLKTKGDRDEKLQDDLLNDIKENELKISHHGKRADEIVKGMLQHSRSSTGQKELTDLNALADEYLRLAYHGLRAKDKSFNADFQLEFDDNLPKIKVVPQDIGRVFLNLINNAFYVVNKKSKEEIKRYDPEVIVATRKIDNQIEICVKDNGPGIPEEIKEKIFQPFFTTKPTGEGTGLGLSLSYDIIKAHGGEIYVDTKENVGTEFSIILTART